jgi:hypothetical protein
VVRRYARLCMRNMIPTTKDNGERGGGLSVEYLKESSAFLLYSAYSVTDYR